MSPIVTKLLPTLVLIGGLALAGCEGVGSIGGPTGAASTGAAGAAAVGPSGAAGTTFSASTGPGAAGTSSATGTGTGAAGTTGTGSGAAGTTGTGSGAAGTASGTGAAGTSSGSGAAGTQAAAGRGGAGTSGAGTAGTTGAGGTGAAGTSAPVQGPHCKRGEAYQANSLGDLQSLSKGVSWWYNWATAPEKSAAGWETSGVEFVPMVWGYDPDVATIVKQIPPGAKYILGFNEPNFGAQSNLTAQQAAQRWPKIMEIARQRKLKIGSPSPQYCAGNCNDTDPFHWLDAFFAACPGCQVDFIATHWYACTGDALKNHLSKFKKYGKPIWVTEFSCMDAGDHTAAGEQAYMKTAVDILENDPTVFRYAWFTGRWPNPAGISLLGSASGALTDLGNLYMTLPATTVCGP